jgi:hypothetical protein
VVIATGRLPGPKLLLTGNIHGNEINPCIICHRVIEWLESAVADGSFKGTVVLMPSLNPTGHRAGTRSPSFESVDPNRYWPDGFAQKKTLSEELAKDTYANIYAYESLLFTSYAPPPLVKHTYSTQSPPRPAASELARLSLTRCWPQTPERAGGCREMLERALRNLAGRWLRLALRPTHRGNSLPSIHLCRPGASSGRRNKARSRGAVAEAPVDVPSLGHHSHRRAAAQAVHFCCTASLDFWRCAQRSSCAVSYH